MVNAPPPAMTSLGSPCESLCGTIHSHAAFEYESAVTGRKTPSTKTSLDLPPPSSPLDFLKQGVPHDEDHLLFFPAERL